MEKTAQYFEKQFFINSSHIFIALPKYYATRRNYEILSKSLVPTEQPDARASRMLERRESQGQCALFVN
jgi:hypothetical protein